MEKTSKKQNYLKEIIKEVLSFTRKTSVKIALVVSLTMLTLLSLLNIVVIERSRDAFVNIVTHDPAFNGSIVVDRDQMGKYNILRFYQDGTERPTPLQEEFVKQFQSSLISVSIIAILASFFIGLISSQIFSRPLLSLSSGMRNLRDNNYNLKLKNIGSEEFDEVVCEFNRLTDQLSKVESLRKDLISDTSHELKTPITSLLGQLKGVKEGVLIMDEKRTDLLIDQVERLSDIVERLQEFARIQGKQIAVGKKKIKLKKFMTHLLNEFETELNNSNIHYVNNINDEATIEGDEYLLGQVFINLISNVLKYSSASEIGISLEENKIIFADNGIGISDEDKPFIFERFYRVEKSRNRKTGGLGLGLAIVREIVQSHGWAIKIEDNDPKGTKFIIFM